MSNFFICTYISLVCGPENLMLGQSHRHTDDTSIPSSLFLNKKRKAERQRYSEVDDSSSMTIKTPSL